MGITSVNSNANSTPTAISDMTVTKRSNLGAVQVVDNKQNTTTLAEENQPSENDVRKVTEELDNFMQSINTDIRFELHTETNTLMVQVEDSKTHKVLKEVPAHELLDMVTKIRECIGVFLDKRI